MVNIQQDWLDDETSTGEQICVYNVHAYARKGCEG